MNENNLMTYGTIVKNTVDKKFSTIENILSDIYKNPNSIFKHKLFLTDEDAIYFQNCLMIGTIDNHLFLEFQEEYCRIALQKIREKIPLEFITYEINKEDIFWNIIGFYKNLPMIIIYPYNNRALLLDNIEIKQMNEELKNLNQKKEETREMIDYLTQCLENPLLFTQDSNLKTFKTMVSKKSTIQQIQFQLKNYEQEYYTYEQESNQYENYFLSRKEDYIRMETLEENFISRLNKLNFVVRKEEKKEEPIENEIEEQIEEIPDFSQFEVSNSDLEKYQNYETL